MENFANDIRHNSQTLFREVEGSNQYWSDFRSGEFHCILLDSNFQHNTNVFADDMQDMQEVLQEVSRKMKLTENEVIFDEDTSDWGRPARERGHSNYQAPLNSQEKVNKFRQGQINVPKKNAVNPNVLNWLSQKQK